MKKFAMFNWMLFLLLFCSCSSNQVSGNGAMFDPTVAGTENYEQPPQVIGVISPDYPIKARTLGIQGVVVLSVEIDQSGKISNVTVKKSIPSLDQAAIDAVNRVKFKPALLDGNAVDATVMIPVEFRLN